MTFKVLNKEIIYKGCPIVIRQSEEHFEYITCINNQIYSSSIVAKKSLIQKLSFQDYTQKQLVDISNYVIKLAETTIDTVLHQK
jgi:hypothetical protein